MRNYIVFLIIILIILYIAWITKEKGFNNLVVSRKIKNNMIKQGENVEITLTIENNKRLPIFFILLEEHIPSSILGDKEEVIKSKYSIKGYQRINKKYLYSIEKRGAYVFKNINITIGDIYGLFTSSKKIEDYKEVVVYPHIVKLNKLKFDNISMQGDYIIKRWLYKDPIYIKGIREYNLEDRMKDIHWKASSKMNKLMVKEYDNTADKEVVVILNIQCGLNYWENIQKDVVEEEIKVGLSIANETINQGLKVGIWTNANLISYFKTLSRELDNTNNIMNILEFCARIDYIPKKSFYDYLSSNITKLRKNNTYILIGSYLNNDDINLLCNIVSRGYDFKIIDISRQESIPYVRGISKIIYGGEKK